MLRAAKRGVKGALGLRPPGRELRVFGDDAFIVSYPKSGNTWVRFMVGRLLGRSDSVGFANIEALVPDIYQHTERRLLAMPRPRFLKSHEYFDQRYRRSVYVVRDPRDVLVSYFHYHLKMGRIPRDFPLDGYARQFLEGRLDPFGTWREHVGGWLGARLGQPDFLLVRYEDLSADPGAELRRIAGLLDLPADDAALEAAVAGASADAMRESERREAGRWKPLRNSRGDGTFVRRAAVGGWREELPPALAAEVQTAWGDLMTELGYHG
ncbi:MAG TPA: sulfotransferase domain-containing protein [Geminicoccaceae bacterium]|nr:sulfotransferase domain-containing protein [Geminicoccaceae bacterium]